MDEIPTESYSVGRPLTPMAPPYTGEDCTFAAQRLNERTIRKARYSHCTFINVSFKQATLHDCAFIDCRFVGCYFRRTKLINCRFEGCKFHECGFPRVSLAACRFYYVSFSDCQIAFEEIEHSLPTEPNVREELCRNLARQSSLLGLTDDARQYRRLGSEARESHLKNGFKSQSDWYRSHFIGWQKFLAFRSWVWSKTNRILWGYCDSGIRLIANFLLTTIGLFPLLYWLLLPGERMSGNGSTTYFDAVLLSVAAATPADFDRGVESSAWFIVSLMSIQSLYSVVLIAMFAAFLFQWSSRR